MCDVFISTHRFETGDKLLLCSDGLYEYFTSKELAECLKKPDLGDISQQLSSRVLEMGAQDNFSILLVEEKVNQPSSASPTKAIPIVK
jgi:protein phosphatase